MPQESDVVSGSKTAMRYQEPATTSTNNWETILEVSVFAYSLISVLLLHQASNGNDVDYRIQASLDGGTTYDVDVVGSTTLTSGTQALQHIVDEAYTNLRVQITSSTADTPDDVEPKLVAKK